MKLKNRMYKCILLFVGCISFYVNTQAQNWDINLLKKINPQNPNSAIMRGFANSAYPIGFASPLSLLTAGYIKKDRQLQYKGWEAAGSLAIAVVITEGLKHSVSRDRPFEKYPGEIYPNRIQHSPSFPSGHAAIAFATATTLTLEFKKWYVVVPAYAWAVCVGYSRLYLGEHYPSDVIGGAVAGAGSVLLSYWISKKIFK